MKQRVFWFLTILLVCQAEARAQFGMGFGGIGGFFAPYVSPSQMVQDRRPITQNVGGPVSRPVQKNNAYWDNLREPLPTSYSLTPRRDIRRGSRAVDEASSQASKPANAARPADPRNAFLGFFGTDNSLVWPKDSPLEGELSNKRAAVDSAMIQLRRVLFRSRPALAELRERHPTQADEFHAWLLGLYNALGNLVQQ